jgi:hypothetical protein
MLMVFNYINIILWNMSWVKYTKVRHIGIWDILTKPYSVIRTSTSAAPYFGGES